ncbi:MAG: DUF3616 domain-containing protein [Burkholderiaceae bacterium]|jgi:hypothetical protein|nr:DUF3616 domain-containing protein [Burkholderiaceae bacterium]
MPSTRAANAVRLEFAPGSLLQTNLSGAAFTGERLWVAGGEARGLDRLRRLSPVGHEVLRSGKVRDFPLADLLDLPGTAEEDADPEGIAVADDPRFGPCMAIAGGKPRWLVPYDAPGADRGNGEHTVFGDLLRHD